MDKEQTMFLVMGLALFILTAIGITGFSNSSPTGAVVVQNSEGFAVQPSFWLLTIGGIVLVGGFSFIELSREGFLVEGSQQEQSQMGSLLAQGEELATKDLAKAHEVYKQAHSLYPNLSDDEKREFYPRLMELYHKISK